MSAERSSESGFSLLETLIAIAILASVMTALGPALNVTARTASRIHQEAQFQEDVRAAGRVFSDIVSQTLWLDKDDAAPPVAGDAAGMEVMTLDAASKSPVTLSLAIEREEKQRLTARFGGSDRLTGDRHVVLDNLSDARFQYMSVNGGRARWRDRWRETSPPALIRFAGVLHYGGQERAFAVEASPGGAAPLHCAFDPVSRQCR